MSNTNIILTRHLSDALLMLDQRLRRWPNINTTLNKYLVFDGLTFQKLL